MLTGSYARVDDPYPLIICGDALPKTLYDSLAAVFPGVDCFRRLLGDAVPRYPRQPEYQRWLHRLRKGNQRVSLPYALTADSLALSPPWRGFLREHCRPEFARSLLDLFSTDIQQRYPDLGTTEPRIGRRFLDSGSDLRIDALLALNTPATRRGAVTRPHTDDPEKLITGLLYFADARDDAGGDLIIYRRRRAATRRTMKWPSRHSLQEVMRIPYRPNTAVFMLNTPDSVHGVSPRSPSPRPRRFVNFVLETGAPLF
ncbi:MAG: 2OG-Fe(II) oxygenase [Pseudomonadota bacterium]